MKTVAFVPIRLNSKRVVGKNLKSLGGQPLMCYVLNTLAKVNGVDLADIRANTDNNNKSRRAG